MLAVYLHFSAPLLAREWWGNSENWEALDVTSHPGVSFLKTECEVKRHIIPKDG